MRSMATEPLTQVPGVAGWRSAVAAASACAILGLLIRAAAFAGAALPPPMAMIGLGAGLVGASLLLSWAADAAEVELSGPLVLAGVVFVTVLPELVIETHFAYTQQTELVSANLTGATRLLLTGAVAMPVLGAWLLARRGQHAAAASYRLSPARRVDLAILFLASLYGILLALLGRVSLIDGLLLIGLYLFFLRRIGGTPDEPPAVVGVSASLAALPRQQRRRLLVGLFALAAVVVTVVAVPFSDALQQTGTSVGISSYLLVQSIVPAATETPEFVVAMTLALNRRPGQGLAVFLAASVVQWTLALGVLPWAYLAGGGPIGLAAGHPRDGGGGADRLHNADGGCRSRVAGAAANRLWDRAHAVRDPVRVPSHRCANRRGGRAGVVRPRHPGGEPPGGAADVRVASVAAPATCREPAGAPKARATGAARCPHRGARAGKAGAPREARSPQGQTRQECHRAAV